MAAHTYRRAIRLLRHSLAVVAEMEDDFHHFRVRIDHDGRNLVAVEAESLRFPWTTCGAESAAQLRELCGLSLRPLRKQMDNEQKWRQCTHLYDLVELAISHVDRKEISRLYQVAVEVLPERAAVQASLTQDFQALLSWTLDAGVITGPEPFSGVELAQLARWGASCLDAETLEAALVLQRGVHVSYGRLFDWSSTTTAAAMGLPPTCYTLNTGRSARAVAVKDHVRDFSQAAQEMLVGGIKQQ